MDHTPGGIAVSLNHLAYTNGFIPPKLSCYGEGWGNSLCGQELCARGRIWCDEVSWNVTTSIKLLMNIFKSVCSCMVWTKVVWKNLKWGSELECDSKVSSCPWISLSICSWCCAWKNRMWGRWAGMWQQVHNQVRWISWVSAALSGDRFLGGYAITIVSTKLHNQSTL